MTTCDAVQYGGYGTLTWAAPYSSYAPANSDGNICATIPTATNLDSITIAGMESSGAPSSIADMTLTTNSLLWQGYNGNNLWPGFNNLNAALKSMTIKNAELTAESSKVSARSAYVASFGSLYGTEATAQLGDAQTALAREINAEKTLNTAVWNASETAHTGTLNAIVASDTSSDVATYINASLGSALTYASSVASAFGDFQIGNRQRRYNNASANDPRKSLYSQDVSWATNMKSLRNQYYDVAGDAISDYYSSLTSAYTSYVSGALTTLSTAEQAYFSALKTYSIAALNADGDYSQAFFAAERDRAEAYIDAAIAELTANYATEANLAASRASAYATQLAAVEALFNATQFADGRGEYDALLQGTSGDQTDYFDEIVSTSSQVVSTQTSANSADSTLATQNASALASAQAANAAAYTVATEQAEADYTTAVNSAWNDAYLEQLSVVSDLKDASELATSNLDAGLENLENVYRAAVFAAYDAFDEEWDEITRVLSYQQTRIDSGLTVGSNVFENPTFDFEVCFVAGTPVLMADGTTKPIEEIRPGDMVLAADHLDPEGKPQAARVARFFDNGEKEVVRLRFQNGEELVCTPSHRFYVCGKGWICSEELVAGDECLTAERERVTFVLRKEEGEGKWMVYNFEVEGRHTYFVGDEHILVHNDCIKCGREIPENNLWGNPKCPHCDIKNQKTYNEVEGMREKNIERLSRICNFSRRQVETFASDVTLEEYIMAYCNFDFTLDEIYFFTVFGRGNESLRKHYVERFDKNKMYEFFELDWEQLSNQIWKDEVENDGYVTCYFLNDRWKLLKDSESVYHRKNGWVCFKWCSDNGRELVIQARDAIFIGKDGKLQKRRESYLEVDLRLMGTYNYGNSFGLLNPKSKKHLDEDIIPFLFHKNVPLQDYIFKVVIKP